MWTLLVLYLPWPQLNWGFARGHVAFCYCKLGISKAFQTQFLFQTSHFLAIPFSKTFLDVLNLFLYRNIPKLPLRCNIAGFFFWGGGVALCPSPTLLSIHLMTLTWGPYEILGWKGYSLNLMLAESWVKFICNVLLAFGTPWHLLTCVSSICNTGLANLPLEGGKDESLWLGGFRFQLTLFSYFLAKSSISGKEIESWSLAQDCPVVSTTVQTFCFHTAYCRHSPHVAMEHLISAYCNWRIKLLMLFNYK